MEINPKPLEAPKNASQVDQARRPRLAEEAKGRVLGHAASGGSGESCFGSRLICVLRFVALYGRSLGHEGTSESLGL